MKGFGIGSMEILCAPHGMGGPVSLSFQLFLDTLTGTFE